ncbi:MAG: helix-turn-helix domain-containing protein [Candidatus Doudnabacteria bacterium]|jgi:sugar-specific transcriptional regulator TrmB
MEIVDVLNKIGLEEKESAVYLALLELGTADVGAIAKKAGVKRPTCYLILDNLKNRGLVSQVPAKVSLFSAEGPEKLSGELYKKQELLKRFLPNLQALHNSKKEKPQVLLFEGHEGIKEVYKKIYSAKEVSFFGTVKEALKYDLEGLEEFVKKTRTEGVRVRDLLTKSAEDLAYAKKAKPSPFYEIRFVAEGKSFLTDNAVFGDSVVFFSFHPQIFAVMISSREVSQAIRTLFEFAWSQAETYEKVLNDNEKTALV